MFPVLFCFSGESLAILLYLPSLVTREVLQYIKFNLMVWLDWSSHWTMFTTWLLRIWSGPHQEVWESIRENWMFCFSEQILFQTVFSYLLLDPGSCSTPLLSVLTPVSSPLLDIFLRFPLSHLTPLKYPGTAGSSTWNWWARGEDWGERESHPGTGGRAGAASGGRGGRPSPAESLISSDRVK